MVFHLELLSDVGYKHGELIQDTVAEWNSSGGINGKKVDLILYNDECKSEKGVANATRSLHTKITFTL